MRDLGVFVVVVRKNEELNGKEVWKCECSSIRSRLRDIRTVIFLTKERLVSLF